MLRPALRPGIGDALLIVDVQNDFLPGGAMPVSGGEQVVAPLNRYLAHFVRVSLPVFASRDWHPADHCSFREQGGLWPRHCVAGTPGAEIASALQLPSGTVLVDKGCNPALEAYSAFSGTGLDDRLRAARVLRLYIGGLATDYCVRETVRGARQLGYPVCLLIDAIRAVEARSGDGVRALHEMQDLGAICITLPALGA